MDGLYKTKNHIDDVRESTAINAVSGNSGASQVDPTEPADQTVITPRGNDQFKEVIHQKAEAQ